VTARNRRYQTGARTMTAKPAQTEPKRPPGRPAINGDAMDRVSIRLPGDDLADLAALHDSSAHAVIRQLVAAYLGRAGAGMPQLTPAQRRQLRELAATRDAGQH
jgi:hypothetical protein